MNFDVRSYCERLAKADQKRFEFIEYNDDCLSEWGVVDRVRSRILEDNESISTLWAFVGPLADELRVNGDNITAQEKQPDGRYLGHLEATFAAVVEKLEAGKP